MSGSPVRGDMTASPDDTTVSVLQHSETSFFRVSCTFKHVNGFQTPNLIQSMYN